MPRDCPICLEPLRWWNATKAPHCRHRFHRKCLERWIHRPEVDRPQCPMCRCDLGPWRIGAHHFEGILTTGGQPLLPTFHAKIDLEIRHGRAALVINGHAMRLWTISVDKITKTRDQSGLWIPVPDHVRCGVHAASIGQFDLGCALILKTKIPVEWPPTPS